MSGIPPATTAVPAKPAKRRSSKARKTGPTVSDRILKVVAASKERGGVSIVALKKGLAGSGYDVVKNNARVRLAVRRLVTNGSLSQTKGKGASGSFRIGKKPAAKKKKKPVKKAKKPKAKRTKKKRKTAAKTGAKTAAGTPKKRRKRKSKSPKKAKKPAAAKRPRSPRKAKRRATKPKRAAAKKK